MKKLLFTLSLALTALIASAAIGDTFTVGNLNYVVKFDSNNLRYAEVHVTGLSAAGKSKTDLALSIPGFVAYGGVHYAVTEVAANAFAGQTNIYQLNVQFGVNAINSNAFKNCSRILIATFGSSMRFIYSDAFTGCTSLDEVCIANLTHPAVYFQAQHSLLASARFMCQKPMENQWKPTEASLHSVNSRP